MIPFVRQMAFDYGRVDQVSPRIRRVIANNPGPFTFHGTGTYIVGSGEVAVIDPGPMLDAHLDALLHAVTDALLGAAGLGDIGSWFPDDDARFKGADSGALLRQAAQGVRALGWQVVNVDCTVRAQSPRLGPHRQAMQQAIAQALDIASDRVNVKAKTSERLGFVGRHEGIATSAACLLRRKA